MTLKYKCFFYSINLKNLKILIKQKSKTLNEDEKKSIFKDAFNTDTN